MTTEAARRVFFALWPGEAQRAAMVHATRKAVRACGGRPVDAANLHLTLCFLGSVAASRIAELGAAARRVAASRALPPTVSLDFERVEQWIRAQLLCAVARDPAAGVEASAADALARGLGAAATAAGFAPDLKPFRAHVTLARKVVKARFEPGIRPVRWEFEAFALVESRTLPAGPVYSVVESYSLVDAQKVRT